MRRAGSKYWVLSWQRALQGPEGPHSPPQPGITSSSGPVPTLV